MTLSIALAVALAVAGCTDVSLRTGGVETPAAPLPAAATDGTRPLGESSDYTYRLLAPEQTGLTQVFDDGRHTYLTFAGKPPAGLMIFDENGKAVPFTTAGHSAIVSTIRGGLLVRTPSQSSYAQPRILERGARVEASQPGETDATAALPADLAAARAEILRAQQRIAGLSAELDKVSRGEASVPLAQIRSEIEEIQMQLNGVSATLVRAHFASGSTVLALSASTSQAILAAAQRAAQVRIRGRADSTGTPAVNAYLARERALSVRRMLIAGGVAPSKLRTSYASADYIASNSTASGRAQNRRVDLVFVGKASEPIHGVLNESSTGTPKLGDVLARANTPTLKFADR